MKSLHSDDRLVLDTRVTINFILKVVLYRHVCSVNYVVFFTLLFVRW